ncbi:RagB/SusD family nutrient uptake outer membrane protein [Tellurirhabdus rosea]|uniref:RagB/SusD family nutrient uptake outer membrane protein n=1 Tax=Tellurirhabdus rosea TaxID=2674997 RepID=UPI002253E3A3|nr:RagB/SusD family nutrient uptake outer membrane protein [Tellurirhabdus rosea]
MKTIKRLTLAAAFLSLTACDSMLEMSPISQIVAQNFWQTAGDAEAGLMNMYNFLQAPVTQNVIIVPSVMGDDGRAVSGGNFTRHEAFTVQPGQGNVSDFWRDYYFAVHAANDVLANVPAINDPALAKDRVLGEAYFGRALAFFHLTRLYGKIPLPLQPSKSSAQDFQLKRSEVADVYRQIIADLLEAEKLLPVQHTNRARAAKGAARGWLAKVYLQRGAQGDFDLALKECEEVMADSQYRLVAGASYADLFAAGRQNTPETLFEISYRPSTAVEGHGLDRETVPFSGSAYRLAPENKLMQAFAASTGDGRAAISVATFNNRNYTRKYEQGPPTTTNRGTQTSNVVLLRLADIVLLRAECLNELGRTAEAIPFLNQIRTRAGLAPTTATTQAALRLAIENERYLELCLEGHRWYDLVRWNKAVGTIPGLTNPDFILWPVPTREIDLNPNLDQNKGY